jgi:hypothetical protein
MWMSSKDYIGVSLRIWSLTRSPTEISALIGRAADSTVVMGSPRGKSHGAQRQAWKTHYWCAEFGGGASVEERIGAATRLVMAHGLELETAVGSEGWAEIYVFLAPESTVGVELPPTLLKPLVDHGVRLTFEFLVNKRTQSPA